MRLSVYPKRVYLCGKFIGHLRTTYLRNSYITPHLQGFCGFYLYLRKSFL